MNSITRKWRNWKHGRQFAKTGKGCRFLGRFMTIDGHAEAGKGCHFRDNIILRTRRNGKIVFDDYAGLSWGVILEALELIHIGKKAGLAESVVIRDSTHIVYGTKEYWRLTPHIVKPVIIGDGCWIGSRAYICLGVNIGEGAVVGANSVVTDDTQIGPYEIWAGVPARFIAHRTDNVDPKKLAQTQKLIEEFGVKDDRRFDL